MKRLSGVILSIAVLAACGDSFILSFHADNPDLIRSIGQNQEGFFILRYFTYRGRHRLGGALNEFAIRNLSDAPLKVESIALAQTFRGQQVTVRDAPIPFDGLGGSIVFGNKPTVWKEIAPGEWMTFDFPTEDILGAKEGDKMTVTFSISLRSGSRHYERKLEFTRTLVRSELPLS